MGLAHATPAGDGHRRCPDGRDAAPQPEQRLFSDNVDLRAGRLAARNDFGTLPDACNFMSFTICADRALTTNLGPLSLKVGGYEVNPNDGGEYGFDWGLGGSTGVIIPAELDWNIKLGQQRLPGIYKIGGSYDRSSYPEWYTAANGLPLPLTTAPPRQNQRGSFYAIAQQQVWQSDFYSNQGLTVLAGYVYNTPDVSLFEHLAFVGFVGNGLISCRPDDRAGFEFAYGRVSPSLTQVQQEQEALGLPLSNSAPGVETHEIILEANYNIRPSGASTYPNAWLAGFRVTAQF
jgi:porin